MTAMLNSVPAIKVFASALAPISTAILSVISMELVVDIFTVFVIYPF